MTNIFELSTKTNNRLPDGYTTRPDGIYAKTASGRLSFLCGPIDLLSTTIRSSADGSNEYGLLIGLVDQMGRRDRIILDKADIAAEPVSLIRMLASKGLRVTSSRAARERLIDMLLSASPPERLHLTDRTGWHDGCFVTPVVTFGTGGPVFAAPGDLRPPALNGGHNDPAGLNAALTAWRHHVGRLAVGNSRLLFALSAALAGPLLEPLGIDSGGFHFVGASSSGKSTIMLTAAHAAGRLPIEWNSTLPGLEAACASHSDGTIFLDEISSASKTTLENAAYLLGNGVGRTRMGVDGSPRETARWRALFLSSGEEGLETKLGKRVNLGAGIRMVELRQEIGAKRYGLETLHDCETPDEFFGCLRDHAPALHGVPMLAFLSRLFGSEGGPDDAIARAKTLRQWWLNANLRPGTNGQLSRVAHRFSAVAAAGELAVELGVLPVPRGHVFWACSTLWADWLSTRETAPDAPGELEQLFAQVRGNLQRYGFSRFGDLAGDNVAAEAHNESWGYRERTKGGVRFLVWPSAWKDHLVTGFDPRWSAQQMAERGFLEDAGKDRHQVLRRVAGQGPRRFYSIAPSFMGEGRLSDHDEREDVSDEF